MRKAEVSVVIATRERPQLLRRAIASVLAQEGVGRIEVIVVFDGTDIDPLVDIEAGPHSITTIANRRSSGLAGARNSGILAATAPFTAFCDDDDEWKPGKLAAQLAASEGPDVVLCATGIEIHSAGGIHERPAPREIGLPELLRSRITELHPSSFLFRTQTLRHELGPVDEHIPGSYGEDYDLLLRAAKLGSIVTIPDPLTIVHWDRVSYFTEKWLAIVGGLSYLLDKHPEFARDAVGSARIEGQIAFAHGALGNTVDARAWARRSLQHNPWQPRAYLAMLVGLRLLSGDSVVAALNRRGRGV